METHRHLFLSPCKVNLGLRITGKFPDGYHSLETVMAPVALFDTVQLTLQLRAANLEDMPAITCQTDWHSSCPVGESEGFPATLPSGDENLAVRAARAFFQSAFVREALPLASRVEQLTIDIEKRVPCGAGLGGGSGNAATVFLGLVDVLSGSADLSPELRRELEVLGAKLGADVPFLMRQVPSLCTGRGEVMEPLPWAEKWQSLWVLIAHPGIAISTPRAYAAWDTLYPQGKNHNQIINYNNLSEVIDRAQNDFEEVVFGGAPKLAKSLEFMRNQNVLTARMTGSGSALFALAKTKESLLQLEEELRRGLEQKGKSPRWYIVVTNGLGLNTQRESTAYGDHRSQNFSSPR